MLQEVVACNTGIEVHEQAEVHNLSLAEPARCQDLLQWPVQVTEAHQVIRLAQGLCDRVLVVPILTALWYDLIRNVVKSFHQVDHTYLCGLRW